MAQYRLLRNNKETGPHTAEELIHLGFKKYDLIWAEGKSAAWRYPGELKEFKPYAPVIEEQPFDRFYKKPSSLDQQQKESTDFQVAEVNIITAIKNKPRIKIKADCKKIEAIPVCETIIKKVSRTPETEQLTTPEWKDMWLDWEQEKKAVSGSTEKNNTPDINTPLEVKYSQSLDEIKERYIEKILKTKNNPTNSKTNNYLAAAILIGCILATGIWMGLKWSGSSTPKTISPKNENFDKLPVQTADIQISNAKEKNIITEEQKIKATKFSNEGITENSGTQKSENVYIPNPQKKQVAGTVRVKEIKTPSTSLNTKPLSANQKKNLIIEKNSEAGFVKPVDNIKVSTKILANSNAAAIPNVQNDNLTIFHPSENEPQIKDYILVKPYTPNQSVATGVRYTVQNISEIKIDLVMIDLQYYDSNGHYQKGETVYVRNINAGQNITVEAPDYPKAAKINFQISMISSEAKKLYLIAD